MRTRKPFLAFASLGVIALGLSLAGCKGRTRDNVEPTGETVRVEINKNSASSDSAQKAPDSILDYAAPAEPSQQ